MYYSDLIPDKCYQTYTDAYADESAFIDVTMSMGWGPSSGTTKKASKNGGSSSSSGGSSGSSSNSGSSGSGGSALTGNDEGNFFENTFGAGSSTISTLTRDHFSISEPSPVIIKQGVRVTTTIEEHGDSSKPISVSATGVSNAPLRSYVSLKGNGSFYSDAINLGLDNISYSGSATIGEENYGGAVRISLVDFKVGVDLKKTIEVDDFTTRTEYTNVSISGWWILASAYAYVTGGQPLPQYAPAS